MTEPFHHRLRVRFNECDPQGVVFNANFLTYADIALTELYREAFGSWTEAMRGTGADMVVAESNARYLSPVRFDEELDLTASVTRLGTTSTTVEVEMERDGETCAIVSVRHVCVDVKERTKTPIPDSVRAGLERYASPSG